MANQTLDYLFNHMFLPVRVPYGDDHGNGSGDRALIDYVKKSAELFRDSVDIQYYQQWSKLCRTLRTFTTLHQHNNALSKDSLKIAFGGLPDGDILILYVAMQNSALILRKVADGYIIESFEASPPAPEVLSAHTSLQWDFPSRAITIPTCTFQDQSFQSELAAFLEKASIEPVQQFAAVTLKAGSFAYESRNTTTPAIVGQLLMTLFEAYGHEYTPKVTRKRVRDEVSWSDGAENPWRRSATWLVLRVSLQRCLCFLLGGTVGTLHYKFFMCFVTSLICKDLCAGSYPADIMAFARTKLARRAAKLEERKSVATPQLVTVINSLFHIHGKKFTMAIQTMNAKLEETWNLLRARATRQMERLPRRTDSNSTVLSLSHSRTILQRILAETLYGRPRVEVQLPRRLRVVQRPDAMSERQYAWSAGDYLDLADLESELKAVISSYRGSEPIKHPEKSCAELKQRIQQFLDAASFAYKSNPEHLSLMLLLVMELWQTLDTLTLRLYPQLVNYSPGFPSNLLFSLQISSLEDMRRLQDVGDYLETRQSMAEPTLPSVFGDILPQSFAVRYFDQCLAMQGLLQEVEVANETGRARKVEELKEMNAKYEELSKEVAQTACPFPENMSDPLSCYHEGRGCQKHHLMRKLRSIKITTHEALLPSNSVIAKAAVFEIIIPQGFASWREITWQILQLARRPALPDQNKIFLLQDYSGLSGYMHGLDCNITLASRTKSFQETHYAKVPLPATPEQVCLPHGLKYDLFDRKKKIWTSRQTQTPSFADVCCPPTPPKLAKSVYASLQKFVHPTLEDTPHSANDTVASQTRCPNSLTVTEFTAYQDLRLGSGLPWLRLLRELASPNINFGAVEVGVLVSQLALMAGASKGRSALRASHWVFRHTKFCEALAVQIRRRLDAVATNWRECQTVNCMIVLLLRMWSLSISFKSVKEAEQLLLYVRKLTHGWVRLLRDEMCNARDVETAQKRAKDASFAAILSRKTFVIEASKPNEAMEPETLSCFLECGFTLKDNLPKDEAGNITKMPSSFKHLLISDLKLVKVLESRLRASIETHPKAVHQAVNNFWAEAGGKSSRTFTDWAFICTPYHGWFTALSIVQAGLVQQAVHIDLFEGTLLVDGQPLGRLPDEFTEQPFFHQIFGSSVFLTYPSSLPGMSHMLASLFQGNEIHFGFRADVAFLRARTRGRILEWIPPTVFLSKVGGEAPDLPLPLVNDCVHWLDVSSCTIDIRPTATMWQIKQSNWTINLGTNQAWRRSSLLVDPRSPMFDRVARLIEPFEHRSRMTLFQPERRNLTLHLPNLELFFTVNREGLLESSQLKAAVDMNQDAGTLYGLKSSLVLRDSLVPEGRSVIVAMGPTEFVRNPKGDHVSVKINHTGYYARFNINKELGRLDCAAEPRLIYFKAYCHAITSFVLPDPLTGRTGTDQAIHCLLAGNAQPWMPVDDESYRILLSIAELTPRRVYYPEKLKALQKVIWKEDLVPCIQHDAFWPIVKDILHQCNNLHLFHLSSGKPPSLDRTSDEHLLARAMARHQMSGSSQHRILPGSKVADRDYIARDSSVNSSAKNTYEAVVLLKTSSTRIAVNHDLAKMMQDWPVIQGFDHQFKLHLFADLLKIDLALCWGSLFKHCQQTWDTLDKFHFIFLFATISFGTHIDMTTIRSLIAVCIMQQLKEVQAPRSSVFIDFRKDLVPTVQYLMQYMQPFRAPYPEDERSLLSVAMQGKQRRKLELAQHRHEQQSENSCVAFARHLLSQWPCRDPVISNLEETPLLDTEKAWVSIEPQWKRLCDNHQLSEHLRDVQTMLNLCEGGEAIGRPSTHHAEQEFYSSSVTCKVQPTMTELLCKPTGHAEPAERKVLGNCSNSVARTAIEVPNISVLPALGTKIHMLLQDSAQPVPHTKPSTHDSALASELREIVTNFSGSDNAVRQAFGKDLQSSIIALQNLHTPNQLALPNKRIDAKLLGPMIVSSRRKVEAQLDSVRDMIFNHHPWLALGRLLPDVTPVTLLEALPTLAAAQNPSSVIYTLIKYAQLITELQHLLRIQGAHQRSDSTQLAHEMHSGSRLNWQKREVIDWLLLQIDFNLLIREDQYEVARAMISPRNGDNSVLQMNMGQGKSSVIIPMIVAQMANGKNLVRVVVPRPLLLQTAQLLQSRLGGLIGRRLKHIPFSRRSSTDVNNLKVYQNIHSEMLRSRGVMLTLPEHMLSFQLSGLQELSNGHLHQAESMLRIQNWFASKCRDILDECDHMLAVKTQLIYPSGSQSIVDGHPSRWIVVQDLLKLVKVHLDALRLQFPQSIEVVERGSGMFPTIYLLSQDAKEDLVRRLTNSVANGEAGILPLEGCSQEELELIGIFLRDATFPKDIARKVGGVFRGNPYSRQRLLLLRGLIVHRILLMGLSKRWNVHYGIDPRRDPIAVPFRSKGMPSDQAEFGHPDVSIMLTCLSFYYSGLTMQQFKQTLHQLLQSDEPAQEYESWIYELKSFPESLRSWTSINTEDDSQCDQLWVFLCRQVKVINFFLNQSVFPRHAKTFEQKLVSSGWDVIIGKAAFNGRSRICPDEDSQSGALVPQHSAKGPSSLTVGFSGTNDNKTLLPLNVKQNDLPRLLHTNAEVLTYLLQPRNRGYFPAIDRRGRRLTERGFLEQLEGLKIRMLLDAGAQIVELDNLSLAKTWLLVDTEAEAAVYFGEDGRARVVYRDGRGQPLATSPFHNNLGSCVVYLDEAHTRGVDLKMPGEARAALTLGIMQTKDHTVQGKIHRYERLILTLEGLPY